MIPVGQHIVRRKILWSLLPDGSYYPFALKDRRWEVLLLIGRWDVLDDEYRQGLQKAQMAGDMINQAKILMRQGELLCRLQKFDEGEEKLKQALEKSKESGDARLQERVEDQLAGCYLFTERYDEAEAIFDRLCATAEGQGNEPSLGWFLNHKATIAMKRRQTKQALAYIRRRIKIAKRYGNPRDIAHAYMTFGGILGFLDKYRISYHYSYLSAEINRRIGDIFMLYYTVYNMAWVCEKLGRLQEALRYYQEDLAMARKLGDRTGESQIMGDIARVKSTMNIVGKGQT